MSATVPGTIAKHAIISDECRRNRGEAEALAEAMDRLWREYESCAPAWKDKGARFHFVLTLERPTADTQEDGNE